MNNIIKEYLYNIDINDEIFNKSFDKRKRLKIATLKVSDKGKNIGKQFLDIVEQIAIENNIDEIYTTIYRNQENLINLLKQNGYKFYTTKETIKGDRTIGLEDIMIKSITHSEKHTKKK